MISDLHPDHLGSSLKRLPIGIQTFRKIIENNYVYVDKTRFALNLIESGGEYYFLSRPRRFGKSLFLDTLSEIFKGSRELFKGLYIYDKYDFKSYPVIKISFGSGDYSVLESIEKEIKRIIHKNVRQLNIDYNEADDFKASFEELIYSVYSKYNKKVVILIDEYDKPILDNILDRKRAGLARDILKNFYSVIKDSDEYIRFVFITGVSKFSKVNLFSGLNNFEDITLNRRYAEICGYSHNDLKTVFKDHLKDIDLDMVKRWYNGYYYFGEKVYNPFDILLFISNNLEFKNYWWNTGNPSFLIEKLHNEDYYIPELENAYIAEEELEAFDVEYIDLLALLWQTGYLTFEDKFHDMMGRVTYKLKVPNLEIQFSLNELFIDYLTNQRHQKRKYELMLLNTLLEANFSDFINVLKSIFASIPYHNYANNIIARYEGYYSSVVYVYLCALGYDVVPEDVTNRGRIDLTIKLPNKIIILEFKVDSSEEAIEQIEKKKYYEKYLVLNVPIYFIGIKFNSQKRNISNWQIRQYKPIS